LPGGDGEPGDEGDVVGLGVIQDVLVFAYGEVVHVLHRHDLGDLPGFLQLGHGHL
jgi:hypothetical protein